VSGIIMLREVAEKILDIRDQKAILDRDVAELYGVDTREVNQAVRNNPDKFPDGYIIKLDAEEWDSLKSKILTLKNAGRGQHSKFIPSAFTEKGLYMLATILKSLRATETTIAIVETFTKMRELTMLISQLPDIQDENSQKELMQKSGDILAEVLDDTALEISGDETTIEINLAVMKIKHTVKREKPRKPKGE